MKKEFRWFDWIVLFAFIGLAGYSIATNGMGIGVVWAAFPFLIFFVYFGYKNPAILLYSAFVLSFILPILGRYVPSGIPYGLLVDVILVAALIILFIRYFRDLDLRISMHWSTILLMIWMMYVLFQLFNPEAHSMAAWFYAMRGIALYQLLVLILAFKLIPDRKHFYNILHIWLGLSLLGVLWGIKQQMFGVSAAEQAWLDEGNAKTHILFGKLRVFSYYYDAGTYGAAMAQAAVTSAILAIAPYSMKRRIIYGGIAVLCLYGMLISGTRGAIAIPALGGLVYLFVSKNFKIFFAGITVLVLAFSFLKFTTIGQSNYDIARLRTSLNSDDPSLQIRFINRARLTVYLADKPIGGGIGTTSSFGKRFSPNTWLAHFEPDGLYTRIRAETGLIGRNVFVGIFLAIAFGGAVRVWKMPDGVDRYIGMAILATYAGILLANYSNSLMTQFPLNFVTYFGIVYLFCAPYWDEDGKFDKSRALQSNGWPISGSTSKASE